MCRQAVSSVFPMLLERTSSLRCLDPTSIYHVCGDHSNGVPREGHGHLVNQRVAQGGLVFSGAWIGIR